MHSLPSRRRLSQPIFFRSKCHRLSPLPAPTLAPPPALPPLLHLLPRLLAAAPQRPLPACAPAPLPAATLARRPPTRRQTRRRRRRRRTAAQAGPRTPGTVRRPAVGRQGRGTLSQSANRDSVMPTITSPSRPLSTVFYLFSFFFLWSLLIRAGQSCPRLPWQDHPQSRVSAEDSSPEPLLWLPLLATKLQQLISGFAAPRLC